MAERLSHSSSDGKSLVLGATDIVELVGQSVQLKRAGRNYVGLCPFHNEKSPSFNVNSEKQFFHCFGCKKSGNAIDFVIFRDNLPFIDALKFLAERAGVELPNTRSGGLDKGEKQILLDAQSAACAVFTRFLAHEQIGKPARDYLESRGFSAESVKKFQIGYVPEGWDNLLRSNELRKFTPQQLATAGLAKSRDSGSGFYDTFRNRLMFPIRDEAGRVIAFGGRVMPGSPDPAKYLNSPETPLFSKSKCAYGLDLARHRIGETRTVAVVEGYTDVVMAHQYGATNVVSILGTAMTPQHLSLLRRFAERVVLLFDADEAGDTAVNRAVELFLTMPVEVAIASIPEDLDPDEYLLKHGQTGFQKLLDEAQDALTFKWKALSRDVGDNDDLTQRSKLVEQYLELLSGARMSGPVDPIRWGTALARVSRLVDIPVDVLNKRFAVKKAPRKGSIKPPSSAQMPQEERSQEPNTSTRPTSPGIPIRRGVTNAQDRAELWLLGALLRQPDRWRAVQEHVSPEDFTDADRHALAVAYWDVQRFDGEPVFNEFLSDLQSEDLKELAIRVVEDSEKMSATDEGLVLSIESAIGYLRLQRDKRQKDKQMSSDERSTHGPDAGANAAGGSGVPDEAALLASLTAKARITDLRRGT